VPVAFSPEGSRVLGEVALGAIRFELGADVAFTPHRMPRRGFGQLSLQGRALVRSLPQRRKRWLPRETADTDCGKR